MPHVAFARKVIGQNVVPPFGEGLTHRVADGQTVVDGGTQVLEEYDSGHEVQPYGAFVVDEAGAGRLGVFFPDDVVEFVGEIVVFDVKGERRAYTGIYAENLKWVEGEFQVERYVE